MNRPLPYVPSDLLEEAHEAIRLGSPVSYVASQIGLNTAELNQLLGRPQWQTIPDDDDGEIDLFGGEDVL